MELIIPFIIVAILLIVLIAFARLVSSKCPECKELNTLEEIDRIKIDERMVNETKSIKKEVEDLEIETLFDGEFDNNNAYIHLFLLQRILT